MLVKKKKGKFFLIYFFLPLSIISGITAQMNIPDIYAWLFFFYLKKKIVYKLYLKIYKNSFLNFFFLTWLLSKKIKLMNLKRPIDILLNKKIHYKGWCNKQNNIPL